MQVCGQHNHRRGLGRARFKHRGEGLEQIDINLKLLISGHQSTMPDSTLKKALTNGRATLPGAMRFGASDPKVFLSMKSKLVYVSRDSSPRLGINGAR